MDNMKQTPEFVKALIASLSTDDTHIGYLPSEDGVRGSASLISHYLEELEYALEDCTLEDFTESYVLDLFEDIEGPDFDSFAPYYSQQWKIVSFLSGSETGNCEDYLEEMYGKNIFDGCDSFAQAYGRMAYAAIQLAWQEVKDHLREEIEGYVFPEVTE